MKKASRKQAAGLPFRKLHGAGNDILVVESKDLPRARKAAFLKRMAHRQLGLGCDQVVEVLSRSPLALQIWNQDGSKAEMCANGSRVALFVAAREGWVAPAATSVALQVSGKPYEARRVGAYAFELSLGEPVVHAPEILTLAKEKIPFWPVTTGNPHAVVFLGEAAGSWAPPKGFDFRAWGPRMETHRRFPQRTNVEFVRSLRLKGRKAEAVVEVWERGAGATLSCGSGAVAVAAVLHQGYGVTDVAVRMTSFTLRVRFEGLGARLSGPVAPVAEGLYFP